MTDLRTAAQQALEALESGLDVDPIFAGETIAALKAALEQPEQEPVAWRYQNSLTDTEYLVWNKGTGGRNWTPLYTHPPRREAKQEQPEQGGKTGWPPGLLQDDCRGLSKWLASQPDARRRVREAVAALEQPNECHWYQDGDEDSGTYMASCSRRYFVLDDGTPTDNRMTHCCYCGKPLVEVPIEPEDNHD